MSLTRRTTFLALVLMATAAVWYGAMQIQLNGDDYQYLASLAPIEHFSDIFRPFVTPDANPSFFRPLSNLTMSLDFLLFGWNGTLFHATNLFFHLVATVLTYFIVKNVFRWKETVAIASAFFFGIVASHEYNLMVDTARADMLVAIFTMSALLCQNRARKNPMWSIAAWVSIVLALLSKESAVLLIPFLILYFRQEAGFLRTIKMIVPYLILAILFYFYHSHYTISAMESQPLTAAGAHSIAALLRNGLYSIVYFFVPLDLSTATDLLVRFHSFLASIAAAGMILLGWLFWHSRNSQGTKSLFPAVQFTVVFGIILLFTFERWRLYLPSVGLAALLPFAIANSKTRIVTIFFGVLFIGLCFFHIDRAFEAESEWRTSTNLLEGLRLNLRQILSEPLNRKNAVGFLDVPAKLGSASVLQLGKSALVDRAEADKVPQYYRSALIGTEKSCWCAVDVYALDRHIGFRELTLQRIAPQCYLVSVPDFSEMVLYPANLTSNVVARRDLELHTGDSIKSAEFLDIIRSAQQGLARSIEVHVLDTSALLLSYSG
ncbi:MAG TPA: hypothetical protein VGM92_06850, partial [Candidatus Kapabacteria bacterium]